MKEYAYNENGDKYSNDIPLIFIILLIIALLVLSPVKLIKQINRFFVNLYNKMNFK